MNKEALIAYAGTLAHRKKVDAALFLIERAFDSAENWYVAFSGGKDSTVTLDLVRRLRPGIPAVWSDGEFWLPETGEYMTRMKEMGLELHQLAARSRHSSFFTAHAESDLLRVDYCNERWQGAFVGVRANESSDRRKMLRAHGQLFYGKNRRQYQAYPVAWWTVYDIWGYIHARGIDYNRAYEKMEAMGVGIEQSRIGPMAVERVLQYGQMVIFKKGWPELYEKFAKRYPEADRWI